MQGREKWPPHTLAKGLTRDNEPKRLQCLKGNNNNNTEKRAERRLSWDCCVCQLCPSTMAQGQEPGSHWGSRAAPSESRCCSFSLDGFLPGECSNGLPWSKRKPQGVMGKVGEKELKGMAPCWPGPTQSTGARRPQVCMGPWP